MIFLYLWWLLHQNSNGIFSSRLDFGIAIITNWISIKSNFEKYSSDFIILQEKARIKGFFRRNCSPKDFDIMPRWCRSYFMYHFQTSSDQLLCSIFPVPIQSVSHFKGPSRIISNYFVCSSSVWHSWLHYLHLVNTSTWYSFLNNST